jgi:hypothetical protein
MAKSGSDTTYVTTRELAAELRSMRWEMRFLLTAVGAANFGLAYTFGLPGATHAVEAAQRVLAIL